MDSTFNMTVTYNREHNAQYPIIVTDNERVTVKLVQRHDNLMTLECHYPRYIHSEVMTHCMFSKSCASSRAIPVERIIEEVYHTDTSPLGVQSEKHGMSGGEVLPDDIQSAFFIEWNKAKNNAIMTAHNMHKLGVHKQFINRILEPFQTMHMVLTGTEWEHFLELRTNKDTVDPMMYRLAKCIQKVYDTRVHNENIEPNVHIPYVTFEDLYVTLQDTKNSVISAMKVSAARCARVSYYKHDRTPTTVENDIKLFNRLYNDKHMSPMEHQAVHAEDNSFYYKLYGFIPFRYMLENGLDDVTDD